jgi:hypothetical protein
MSRFDKARRASAILDVKRHRAWARKNLRVAKASPLTSSEKLRTRLAVLAFFVLFILIVLPH